MSDSEYLCKTHYSNNLCNKDLAPLEPSGSLVSKTLKQHWTWYDILSFWMSDVHSVGGYVFAASLFALGLNAWEVIISLLSGILIVQLFANLLAHPGQKAGVPYAVVSRMSFGVFGANIPAVIRGLIAVFWYGIQTFLASESLSIILEHFFPGLQHLEKTSFVGLSYIGWISFLTIWFLQALVFWKGMELIRRFIDYAGPAVYIVMISMAIWMVSKAGWQNISFTLSNKSLSNSEVIWEMILAIALVAGYFAGPTLNFSDFSRFCNTYSDVKKGNLLGLPVNFLFFSIVSVIIVAATLPVYGTLITNPVDLVSKVNNTTALVLGAFTFITATIGINIVANFVSPAFDFSNISPKYISWRAGGMIAALGSVFLTPWNLFSNPASIHYSVDLLAGAIGPIYGILLTDYYLIKKKEIDIDSLFSDRHDSSYWYSSGVNKNAVISIVIATIISISITFIPGSIEDFSLFIGGLSSALIYKLTMQHSMQSTTTASKELI